MNNDILFVGKLNQIIHVNKVIVECLSADVIILALGSKAVMPRVEGIDLPKAVSCIDVLTGKSSLKQCWITD